MKIIYSLGAHGTCSTFDGPFNARCAKFFSTREGALAYEAEFREKCYDNNFLSYADRDHPLKITVTEHELYGEYCE